MVKDCFASWVVHLGMFQSLNPLIAESFYATVLRYDAIAHGCGIIILHICLYCCFDHKLAIPHVMLGFFRSLLHIGMFLRTLLAYHLPLTNPLGIELPRQLPPIAVYAEPAIGLCHLRHTPPPISLWILLFSQESLARHQDFF